MNLRPSGYEPDELPGCSTPRQSAPLGCSYILAHLAACVNTFFKKFLQQSFSACYSSLLRSSAGRMARYKITAHTQERMLFTSVTPLAILVAMLASSTVWPKI